MANQSNKDKTIDSSDTETSTHYDVVVIGSGPAGYVAAIRASQLGLKTACVDQWVDEKGKHHAGGTCLNVGCIPSKALLESSENYHRLNHDFINQGISVENANIDVKKMMLNKEQIVNKLTAGISQLFKHNKITFYPGKALITGYNNVQILPLDSANTSKPKAKEINLQADNIIIATGSSPMDIPVAPVSRDDIKSDKIVDSSGALAFEEIPKSLGIIGAGVIGLELGSVWARLGTKVTILEAQDEFLSMTDKSINRAALSAFKKSSLDIRLGARVTKTDTKKNITVTYIQKEKKKTLSVEKLLVAVGRVPNSTNLFSHDVDILLDERGYINVDKYCRTNIPHIYAIGDVVRGPMLAHKGSEEGMAVAESINNINKFKNSVAVNLALIPSIIYTFPEIAWVGQTEQQLKSQGVDYATGQFPFAANGRAIAMHSEFGHVKILSDKATDQILGVHIIGGNASEMIAQAVIAMEFESSTEDLSRTIFAHPTLSEAIHEAALACDNRAIHKMNR